MATERSYIVQLTPATKTPDYGTGFSGYSCMLMDPAARTFTISASSLPAMQAEVRRLVAEEFKKTAAVYVRLPSRKDRKPPGFDQATKAIQFIEYHEAA